MKSYTKMGVQEEHDHVVSGGKGEQQVKIMKEQAGEIIEFYVSRKKWIQKYIL